MNRQYYFTDKWNDMWNLTEPLVMGYLDHPMIKIGGRGEFPISPDAFEALAVEYLRAHGYVVVTKEDLTGESWIGSLRDTLTTLEQRIQALEQPEEGEQKPRLFSSNREEWP